MTEPKDSILTIKYRPDGESVCENPPRFTWMPEGDTDEGIAYFLEISSSPDFEEKQTITDIPYNFYTPDKALRPGTWYWRYGLAGDKKTSKVRHVRIPEDAAETPLPGRTDRYQNCDMGHPRLWLNQSQIEAFREELDKNPNYCNFQEFYKNSVLKYAQIPFVSEPEPYPDNKRVVHLWRQNYTICQEALAYIRSLAAGGRILGDDNLLDKAKAALLILAGWDVNGPTSRNYNDECAFRAAYALAFGYDWLYDRLNGTERETVRNALLLRTKQVADHVIVNSRIHFSLYDSHAVRSLSSVLTPCCIAMLGECSQAESWLNYTIEYFSAIYTPWGGADGGWAEGPMYWVTAMAFVTEAINTIKSFTGIDFYRRPFFQKTGDFPLYCNPVDTCRASFCDQSNLGKYPGHKQAYNIRQLAGATGIREYQWYYEQVFLREPEIDTDFFNSGWWDFYFDDMVYQHDYQNVEWREEKPLDLVKWFRDIGWVAINKNPGDFENHLFFLTKSSPYGSVSHSHGDQNSILLHAFGEPLLIKSGYYIGFNTSMHKDWRRQTKSHNNILIDGRGQYAGMDKVKQLEAAGEICEVRQEERYVYVREQSHQAYKQNVPYLKSNIREIYFIDEAYFVIVDTVETDQPSVVDFNLHSLSSFDLSVNSFSLNGGKAQLDGRFVYVSSGIDRLSQTDEFEGVDLKEIDGLKKQWHMTMKTGKAGSHVIITLLVPSKKGEKQMVSSIKDDQGHDIFFYFSHDGQTFSLRIDGDRRY